jgi:hypothetical protein
MKTVKEHKFGSTPNKKMKCEACGQEQATSYFGNIGGFYIALGDSCITKVMTLVGKKYQQAIRSFLPEVANLFLDQEKEVEAKCNYCGKKYTFKKALGDCNHGACNRSRCILQSMRDHL